MVLYSRTNEIYPADQRSLNQPPHLPAQSIHDACISGIWLHWIAFGFETVQTGDGEVRLHPDYFIITEQSLALPQSSCRKPKHCVQIRIPDNILELCFTPYTALFSFPRKTTSGIFPGMFNTLLPVNSELQQLLLTVRKQEGLTRELPQVQLSQITRYLGQLQQQTLNTILSANARKPVTRYEVFQRVQLAKDYILSRFETINSLREIGRVCSLAPSHLLKHYKTFYGTTPHQHIIRLKIDYAKSLLKTTNAPISDIMQKVGFKNLSSFTRLFRVSTGVTPSAYRSKGAKTDDE